MEDLSQFTEENAIHIAEMLNEKFDHFYVWEDKAMVGFKDDHKREQSLYIYPSGKVSFMYNDGEPGGSGYKDINCLPITDYLREQGIKFKY